MTLIEKNEKKHTTNITEKHQAVIIIQISNGYHFSLATLFGIPYITINKSQSD